MLKKFDIEKIKSSLLVITMVCSVITGTIFFLHEHVYIPYLNKQIEIQFREKIMSKETLDSLEAYVALKNRMHSLEWQFSKKTGIEKADVTNELVQAYFWVDSAKKFYKMYLPIFENNLHVIDIGWKKDVTTNEVYYLHEDGVRYPAIEAPNGQHYWVDKKGKIHYAY